MDLKAFFDEVDHDILMGRVRRKVKDRRVNRLINLHLKAGALTERGEESTEKGTPQGGPLSPLLSNILLDDLAKELYQRTRSQASSKDVTGMLLNSIHSTGSSPSGGWISSAWTAYI